MLGAEYLDTRKRLGSIIGQIKKLSHKIGVSAKEVEGDELESWLTNPFRILVCGEPGVGKSSFISALVEKPVAKIGEQKKAIKLYGSSKSCTEEIDESLEYQRISNLGEIEWIDTKGVGEMNNNELARLKELMLTCDFVLWMVSAENPWASHTWELITSMSRALGVRNALILQQVDLRDERDIPILLNHLQSLSQQRVGYELPIYCLSAEIAKKSREGKSRDDEKWKSSGFKEFEEQLDRKVVNSRARVEAMQACYERAKLVIDRLDNTFFHRKRALQGDQHVLQAVEAEVERAREKEMKNARENLNLLGGVVSELAEESVRDARKKNGVIGTFASLFTRGDGAVVVEKRLQEMVSDRAAVRGRQIANNMLDRCKDHWEIMRPELQRKMEVDVVDFDVSEFKTNVEKFSEKMEQSMRRSLVLLKLRRLLDRMMVARQRVLKKVLIMVLGLVSLAGIIGYMSDEGRHVLSFFLLGIVVLLVFWMFWYGKKTKDALLSDYSDTLVAARWHLADMLRDDYVDGVRVFFTAYAPMFENIRRYIVEAEADLAPKHKEWHELFLMLTTIEQEI